MPIDFGITAEEFRTRIQGKRPYLFKNSSNNTNIDWGVVNELIGRHDHASANFKILKNGLILKYDYLEQYQEVFTTKYRAVKSKLYELMKSGASLALNKIENCWQTDQIKRQIAHFTNRQTIVSGYAAFGSEPSFGNHWDTHDVFAVQIIGRKRWQVYAPTESNPLYKNSSVGKEDQCQVEPVMDVILEPGDVFYLPRGWWHEVTATGVETFHLAVGTYPPYVTDYLTWLVEDMSTKSETFRLPADESPLDHGTSQKILEELSQAITSMDSQKRFSQWFMAKQRLDSPYAIEFFGNDNAYPIPKDSQLFINSNSCQLWEDTELIAGGIKVNLNGLSKSIIKAISNDQGISIKQLCAQFPDTNPAEIERFVNEMIIQDVLALHLQKQKTLMHD